MTGYPSFSKEEFDHIGRMIFPDRDVEVLRQKAALSIQSTRDQIERLSAWLKVLEDDFRANRIPEEQLDSLDSLDFKSVRSRLAGIKLPELSSDELEKRRADYIHWLEGLGFFYYEHLAPRLNSKNFRPNDQEGFIYHIEAEERARIVPICFTAEEFDEFKIPERKGSHFQDTEGYKEELDWTEVVWVMVERRLLALNVKKYGEGKITNIQAFDTHCPHIFNLEADDGQTIETRATSSLERYSPPLRAKRWWQFWK